MTTNPYEGMTPAQCIKKFFFPDVPAKDFMEEFKQLTSEDKAELGEGIANGSFTY